MTTAVSFEQIDPSVARERVASGRAVLVDVREPDEIRRERIAGAVAAPLSRFDPAQAAAAGAGKDMVLVCRRGSRAADAAGRLARAGTRAAVLTGGIEGWKEAGLPVERNVGAPLPIMRQVQITAGSLVFIGTALGAFVSPWLLIIPAFVGAGLAFAGATGTCGMAAVLGWMPWNRVKSHNPTQSQADTPAPCC